MKVKIGNQVISIGGITYHCKVCKAAFKAHEQKEMQDPKEHNQYQPHGKPFGFTKLEL